MTSTNTRSAFLWLALICVVVPGCASGPDTSTRTRFGDPDAAFGALIGATRTNDMTTVEVMLGPEWDDVLHSGDPIADKAAHEHFLAMYDASHKVEMTDEGAVLIVGAEEWPMPIPVVEDDRGWYFYTEEGIERILDRRVGMNEIFTIQACLAYIDAQQEYAAQDRDGDGIPEYAQRIRSTPGKRDGLYWKTAVGEPLSPLGELAAEAALDGYDPDRPGDEPRPYQGYYFRILKSQDPSANGGAYDYVVGGSMIGGCALIARPARYGESGVLTFVVNDDRVVYSKDLGEDTTHRAAEITSFDIDGWERASE